MLPLFSDLSSLRDVETDPSRSLLRLADKPASTPPSLRWATPGLARPVPHRGGRSRASLKLCCSQSGRSESRRVLPISCVPHPALLTSRDSCSPGTSPLSGRRPTRSRPPFAKLPFERRRIVCSRHPPSPLSSHPPGSLFFFLHFGSLSLPALQLSLYILRRYLSLYPSPLISRLPLACATRLLSLAPFRSRSLL